RQQVLCPARRGSSNGGSVRETAQCRALRFRVAAHRPLGELSLERAGGGHRLVRIFIVSDMEGVAGIVKWEQTDGIKEKRAYHEGRSLYTEEINAAVRGARTAGPSEIVGMDCHGAGGERNVNALIPDKLDR